MRVFVTGGNGFIGSVVVRRLVAGGHRVVSLLRANSRTERIDDLPITRIIGDVRNVDSLREGIRSCDATIHLAAPGSWADDDSAELRRVIEDGTRNVLDVAASVERHRVVFVSSTAAVNASQTPTIFDEASSFDVRARSLHYAHAKHHAERAALDACGRGLAVTIVNPAEVYGPGDTTLGTARNLVDFATSNPVLVCTGGTSIVHVDDVASGIIAALARGEPGERYILGGDNLTIRQLAELVLRVLGRRARVITIPNWLARSGTRAATAIRLPLPYEPGVVEYATRFWFVDNAKARRALGVTFRSAEDTIRPTIDWLVRAGYVVGAAAC